MRIVNQERFSEKLAAARKYWKKGVIKYLKFVKKPKILLTLSREVQYKKFHIIQGNLGLSGIARACGKGGKHQSWSALPTSVSSVCV